MRRNVWLGDWAWSLTFLVCMQKKGARVKEAKREADRVLEKYKQRVLR